MEKKRRESGSGSFGEEQKKLKAAGKAYLMRNKRARSETAEPKREISCKCKLACKSMSFQRRLELYTQYHSIDSKMQRNYIMNLLHIGKIKRRRHGQYTDTSESHRQATIYYTIPNGTGDHVNVCKATFMDTFGVTRRFLQTLVMKKKMGETHYVEKRKRSAPGKFSNSDINMIKDHINSIPRDVSHYSRTKTDKEYLSPDLNINRLHKAFLEKHIDSHVTYKFYRNVFLKYFPNLSFKKPCSDTCRSCDKLHCQVQLHNQESAEAKIKLEIHQRKAERARDIMKNDRSAAQLPGSAVSVLSIDLQQVLFVPSLTHSDMFYQSQLSCYNLCINLADNGKSFMCFWHEGLAGRGGNEIASCLMFILNNIEAPMNRNIIIWSDNCGAQNKNRMMVFLYMFVVACGLYDSIEHKFLVSGHSFLQCDRDFALIEKRKRKCKPMIPDDVCQVIESSTHTGRFQVVKMCENKFFNFQAAADSLLNMKSAKISQAVHLKIDRSYPGQLLIKDSYSEDLNFTNISVLKKNKTIEDLKNVQLQELPHQNHISSNKKKHLESMIPFLEKDEHKLFYRNLLDTCQ